MATTFLGTLITMAPEVLGKSPYDSRADIWSIGVVFYSMLTKRIPYKGDKREDILKKILTCNPPADID